MTLTKEQVRVKDRLRYQKEKQRRVEYQRWYRKTHPDWKRQSNKNYRLKYPEKFIKYTLKHFQKYGIELNISSAQFAHALTRWSNSVLKRDHHICQICGRKADVAHHILYKALYPQLCLNINNGISLCQGCHYELHGYNLVRLR